uniref:Palmitoyl-protein thioesterase 1 n=1 Tax=Tetraodon nigroviridis TaxID=99883 RepID=H3CG59_TETNG
MSGVLLSLLLAAPALLVSGGPVPVRDHNGTVPLVLWHGMGDSCCNPLSMGAVKKMMEEEIPGIYVLSLRIGRNVVEVRGLNRCVTRGQRCPQTGCNGGGRRRRKSELQSPDRFGQEKPPLLLRGDPPYVQVVNQTYKKNLQLLHKFVMVKFLQDTMVDPVDSEWFGFLKSGQAKETETLQESLLYTEDRLGLAAMDRAGKLVFLATAGDHLQFTREWFQQNLLPFLR